MIDFLIVDDEHLERILIAKSYPWEENGFRLAASVSNGEEGLEAFARLHPALVLTDINMPFMDGLAFAGKIKEGWPDTEIVILTGFHEFSFAHRAVNIGVDSFLLKPVGRDELRDVAEKARAKIEAREERSREERRILRQLQQVKPIVLESFLQRLVCGRVSELEFEERVRDRELGFLAGDLVCAYAKPTEPSASHDAPFWAPEGREGLGFDYCGGGRVFLLRADTGDALPKGLSEDLAAMPWAAAHTIGVGDVCRGTDGIAAAFRQAVEAAGALALIGEKGPADCARSLAPKGNGRRSQLVESVADYVDKRFCDAELSLKTVAREFFINDSYLSRVFKKEMRKGLIEYIMERRMEKAGELLKNSDLRGYQVAEMVGINDPHYFGQCFKKQMGVTVNQFRNALD